MLSSPVSGNSSQRLDSFNHNGSEQVDAGVCNDRRTVQTNSYQQSSQDSQDNDHSRLVGPAHPTQTGLPPVTSHMSYYAHRASSRFKPYEIRGHAPTALETRFAMKNILKTSTVDLSEIDVHQVC